MAVVALTGGIGAGKSQVAEYLASCGATVIDSDHLARLVIERGTPGFDAVLSHFGDVILRDGDIDRKKLGEIVFSDPQQRKALEEIVHPAIRDLFRTAVAELAPDEILVYEIPLLVETGAQAQFDFIITVEAEDEIRRQRLRHRGLRDADITQRMAAQATTQERRALADAVIENNGTHDELLRACENLWQDAILPLK